MQVDVFAEQWVTLPGGAGMWPTNVSKADSNDFVAVVRRDSGPAVFLPEGRHRLTGQWTWSQLPRELPVPESFGLLQLTLNGAVITQPVLSRVGVLWLSAEQNAAKETERDSLSVKVFRKVTDSRPLLVETLVQLNVSGKEREVHMGPMLLDGFVPRSLRSELPARIEPDGSLRVQVKPGRWDIHATAHHQQPLTELNFQPMGEVWPQQEIWAFAAEPELRTVQIQGVPAIDASQTQLPEYWQNLPVYLLTPAETMVIDVLHRGDPNPAANQLALQKELWLAFDGSGYTVKDTISGVMHQNWRLEATESYHLGRVALNGEPQLLTRLNDNGNVGFEVRQRHLDVTAVSRTEAEAELPVSGWQSDFERVSMTLHLPPGWSLLHLTGADQVDGGWLAAWTLWDIFLVLVIAVSIGRVTTTPMGLLAFVTLILTYQRAQAPLFIWLNLAAALALLPYAKGRLDVWLSRYVMVSFVVLVMIILPFSVQQARQAIYPQLDDHQQSILQEQYVEAEYAASLASPELENSNVRQYKMAPEKKAKNYVAAYDPSQKIQVGPGLPDWHWQSAQARWSGPVQASESTRLILISPLWNRVGAALSVVLTFLLAGCLVLYFRRQLPGNLFLRIKALFSSNAVVLVLSGLFICLPTPEARADVVIDQDILQELERRLLQPPKCQPDCAAIESVTLSASGQSLRITMQVHSAADVAFPLPAHVQQWWPNSVTVDGSAAAPLRNRNGPMFVRLIEGRHQITLAGPMPVQDSFSLSFALPLQNVQVQLSEWRVSGLPDAQQTSQTLQLQREQKSARDPGQNRLLPDPIPPYVIVTRRIELGLEWLLTTEVQRVAPAEGVINLSIPLLPGEAPSSGQRNPDGSMDVRFGPQQAIVQWQSSLPATSPIQLTAGQSRHWAEVWSLQTSPIWHSTFSGLQPIATKGEQVMPIWQPWPEEAVTIEVQRPEPIPGEQIAIDQVNLQQQIGKRITEVELELTMRASYGGQFELPLPAASQLKRVTLDGKETPISYSHNQLQIPVRPGKQRVTVQWQQDSGTQIQNRTPELNLPLPSSNIQLQMQLPRDRWVLMVGGPAMGPAILFWGVLAVVLLLVAVLVRSRLTPLKAYQWILLSLGIATFNLVILALVAGWFIALQIRGAYSTMANNRRFNVMQVLLFVFSVVTLLALVSSIPYSLLAAPEMYVVGNGSSATFLQWYQDQARGALPQGWVISLPMYVYRIAMLIWSLWLAFALMGWIRWGWQQLGVQGYWYHAPSKKAEQNKRAELPKHADSGDKPSDGSPSGK